MAMRTLAAVATRTICLAIPMLIGYSEVKAQSNAVLPGGAVTGDDVPGIVSQASDLGRVAPDKEMRVTVWLKGRKSAEFDRAVEQLYTPGSPTYHKWMTEQDLAQYEVSANEAKTVRAELERHGLNVTPDATGTALVARGMVANVESAFHTQIRNYALNGRMLQANATKAALAGNAANLVETVSGLSTSTKRPMLVRQKNPEAGRDMAPKLLLQPAAADGFSGYITDKCFQNPVAFNFTTPGASLPAAIYFGNNYDQGPSLVCGYSPKKLASIYGTTAAAKLGLEGENQTIVIVDAFGSPTVQKDANLFSSIAGLPALDSSNFQIIYPGGQPVVDLTSKDQQGWAVEVALDVEYAHALAPKAKIVLLAALSDADQDLEYALHYATVKHVGDVISNSYGGPEALTGTSELRAYNRLIKRAAAAGIAVNVSSGDSGDFVSDSNLVTVSTPADSPFATSVGGTSLDVPTGQGTATTGWGNNLSRITSAKGIYDPPVYVGFVGGAGGGESSLFPKPAYQKALPGSGRQQPDVSAIADPYTGVPVVYTQFSDSNQYLVVTGGTSVAAPVFSAIWALANELAGEPLGQAAPIIAQLSSPALLDVVPVKSPTNVFGDVVDKDGYTHYAPRDLVPPVSEPKFVSAFYPIYDGKTPSRYDVLSFGTDSSLRVEKGWDNVTGYGTPGGLAFIREAATYK